MATYRDLKKFAAELRTGQRDSELRYAGSRGWEAIEDRALGIMHELTGYGMKAAGKIFGKDLQVRGDQLVKQGREEIIAGKKIELMEKRRSVLGIN